MGPWEPTDATSCQLLFVLDGSEPVLVANATQKEPWSLTASLTL